MMRRGRRGLETGLVGGWAGGGRLGEEGVAAAVACPGLPLTTPSQKHPPPPPPTHTHTTHTHTHTHPTHTHMTDSYNHRIKALNPNTNEITTLAGGGAAGFRDGVGREAAFSEPAGLARGPGGTVLVADTNNAAIRVLDPATKK